MTNTKTQDTALIPQRRRGEAKHTSVGLLVGWLAMGCQVALEAP